MVASQDLADDIQRLVILETGYQAAVRTITPIDHPVLRPNCLSRGLRSRYRSVRYLRNREATA